MIIGGMFIIFWTSQKESSFSVKKSSVFQFRRVFISPTNTKTHTKRQKSEKLVVKLKSNCRNLTQSCFANLPSYQFTIIEIDKPIIWTQCFNFSPIYLEFGVVFLSNSKIQIDSHICIWAH